MINNWPQGIGSPDMVNLLHLEFHGLLPQDVIISSPLFDPGLDTYDVVKVAM